MTLKEAFINPFERYAGEIALGAGILILIINAVLCSYWGIHLDGALDYHFFGEVSFLMAVVEQSVSWLSLAIIGYAAALIFSSAPLRIIDFLGTFLLARWPFLPVILLTGVLPIADVPAYFQWKFLGIGEEVILESIEITFFIVTLIFLILAMIYMVYLMYKAYSTSSNLQGVKGILSYTGVLIFAEIVSKVILYAIY